MDRLSKCVVTFQLGVLILITLDESDCETKFIKNEIEILQMRMKNNSYQRNFRFDSISFQAKIRMLNASDCGLYL